VAETPAGDEVVVEEILVEAPAEESTDLGDAAES
jgi:hypothetical protein